MNGYILIFLTIICFSLSFFLKKYELFTDSELVPSIYNSVHLKKNTNTMYDNYLDKNILDKESASAYMMNTPPDQKYRKEYKQINDYVHLLDYFIEKNRNKYLRE
jgi:hypothetical protein